MSILPVCLQLLQSHNLHAFIYDICMKKEKEAQKKTAYGSSRMSTWSFNSTFHIIIRGQISHDYSAEEHVHVA